jgi:hypothetical protein
MKRYLTLAVLCAVTLLVLAGCNRLERRNDQRDITGLLNESEYTDDSQSGASDDGTAEPRRDGYEPGFDDMPLDTLPWVRFARRYDRPISRNINIDVPAYPGYPESTALATITATATGQFYVHNNRGSHLAWVKDISDEGVRKVYLTRHDDTWRIRRISAWKVATRNAPYPVEIVSVRLEARPSGAAFELTDPDSLYAKSELPAFLPGDTVKVIVTVTGDSASWAFLHRGRFGHHVRQAFYQSGPNVFEREWRIRDDSIPNPPGVRPAAFDVIGWPTLFGDTLAPYNARAWTLPYIVLPRPDAERP